MSTSDDEPLAVPDDGLYTPEIKRHSLEKIRLHNRYARIFATAMHKKWPQLAYVGLYAGAGRARIAREELIVETSALSVLRQPDRFTHYVFADHNKLCVEALAARVAAVQSGVQISIIEADVNADISAVRGALPAFSPQNGLLSFCFIDPFDLQLKFETIRKLGDLRMDFLVLLMLGVDARRNFQRYLHDPSSSRIGDLVDCPNWRNEYKPNEKVIHFVIRKFDDAMQRLGYRSAANDMHPVKIAGMGVLQYVLAFYSKKDLGLKFWRDTRTSLSQQLDLLG